MLGVEDVHVGTPAADFPREESVSVHFHAFQNLSVVKGEVVRSPKFTCAGYEWIVELYPGGVDSSTDDGMASVRVFNKSPAKIPVTCDVTVMKSNGRSYKTSHWDGTSIQPLDVDEGLGWKNWMKRSDILAESNGILKKGTLTLAVRINSNKDCSCQSIKPASSFSEDVFNNLYLDNESADVSFKVKSRVFYAHKIILKARAPDLAELVEQFDKDNQMPMNDVEPETFEIMLRHIYGDTILTEEWEKHSKSILEMAGKYGLSSMKLEAEAWYAKNLNLTADNAVDELLYADGTYCEFLKRTVLDFIIENGQGVLASSSYARLYESPRLMKEVLMEFAKRIESKKQNA